jgi:diaminohydroxyphosphoribosylaminopyrimidine deaminase/5-amino-6-(5-phosphoribosylamino)uracil reductase
VNSQEKYMSRCIALAKNGLGATYPNPMVGSVIVHNDKIIGEGWHKKAGEAHAEVNAVLSVKNKLLLKESTIYVSLEPCSHFGKTPPCCDLIIKNNIPRVVIGTVDPNEAVAGKGIAKLIAAGIAVTIGVLEEECNELNKRFFTFHTQKRPFVILKWAQSQDGFLAPMIKVEKKPVWITNAFSRQLVHKWRTEEQAILVGTQTVIDDNPSLNSRDWFGKSPIRIVLDQNNRIPEDSVVFDNQIKTIVFTKSRRTPDKALVLFEEIDFEKDCVKQILEVLYKHSIQSVIIEGGSRTLQSFIDANLWDEARVFESEIRFGQGVNTPVFPIKKSKWRKIGSDKLTIIINHD